MLERIKDKHMTPSVENMKQGTCGCGRSPTGDCDGSHSLTEDQWNRLQIALAEDLFLNEDKNRGSDQDVV